MSCALSSVFIFSLSSFADTVVQNVARVSDKDDIDDCSPAASECLTATGVVINAAAAAMVCAAVIVVIAAYFDLKYSGYWRPSPVPVPVPLLWPAEQLILWPAEQNSTRGGYSHP